MGDRKNFDLAERSAGDALVIAELIEALAGPGDEDRLEIAGEIVRYFLEVCSRPRLFDR